MACALVALGLPGVARAAAATAGFQPAAVSFISPSWGVALGAVSCQAGQACQARLRFTTDGGASWHIMHAPRAVVNGPGATIGSVLFATLADGWLYRPAGPALWFTRDGGAQWRQVSLGGAIDAMAANARTAYAVVSTGGTTAELFTSPVGRAAWTPVSAVKVNPFTGLAVFGRSVWVTSSARLFTSADGTHWHQYALACPQPTPRYTIAGVAAASPAAVVFICLHQPAGDSQTRELLTSSDGGKTTLFVGEPAPLGLHSVIATPPGQPAIITILSWSDENFMYRSVTGGRTWRDLNQLDTGGLPWNSLSYVSASTGWVVLGGLAEAAGYPRLLKTINSGHTWRAVRF